MSRIPPIDRRSLRAHDEKLPAEKERIERIWNRVREELPVPASSAAQRLSTDVPVVQMKPRRTAARAAMLFAAAGAMFGFAAGVAVMRSGGEDRTPAQTAEPTHDATMTDVFAAGLRQRSFTLPGGGFIVLEPDTLVEVVSVTDDVVRLSLLRGATSVDPGTIGVEVVAGEARISAPAGTSVALARRESDLDVHVGHGAVDVSWPAGHRVVRGGQVLSHVPTVTVVTASEEPPPTIPEPTLATAPPVPTAVASTPRDTSSPPGPLVAVDPPVPVVTPSDAPTPSWTSLARSNKTKEALDLIERGAGLAATIKSAQSAQELMLLWEVATIAKRFDLQVQALERVVSEFGSGPNAYIAAMYLADIYDAKDKTLAAKYREKAAAMKYLTEVTLCEQVRAAANDVDAVDAKWAAQKANEYLQSYPTTSCAEDARSLLEELAPRLAAEKKAAKKSNEEPPTDAPQGDADPDKKNETDASPKDGTKTDGPTPEAPKAPSQSAPPQSGSSKPAAPPSAAPAPPAPGASGSAPTPKAAYPTAP